MWLKRTEPCFPWTTGDFIASTKRSANARSAQCGSGFAYSTSAFTCMEPVPDRGVGEVLVRRGASYWLAQGNRNDVGCIEQFLPRVQSGLTFDMFDPCGGINITLSTDGVLRNVHGLVGYVMHLCGCLYSQSWDTFRGSRPQGPARKRVSVSAACWVVSQVCCTRCQLCTNWVVGLV